MCQEMASPLHMLTLCVAVFPPVSATLILRPAGLYYSTGFTLLRIVCMLHRPHNYACMVPFTKLQHYTIELFKMQISYVLVSGILCSSIDLTKSEVSTEECRL